jgi:hypothetical protein
VSHHSRQRGAATKGLSPAQIRKVNLNHGDPERSHCIPQRIARVSIRGWVEDDTVGPEARLVQPIDEVSLVVALGHSQLNSEPPSFDAQHAVQFT